MTDALDRDTVARVLARARKLGGTVEPDDPLAVTPEALIEAAAEVGIERDAIRDALAIERLPPAVSSGGGLDRLAGPTSLTVERVVPFDLAEALDAVEAWLSTTYRLRCDRRADAIFARPVPGVTAGVARRVSGARGRGRLAGVGGVRVGAVPIAAGSAPGRPRTMLRISLDRRPARQRRLGGGVAVGAAGVGGAALVASEALVLAPLVAVPMMTTGYLLARTGRGHADHVELELERLLSAVERGERPPSRLGAVVGRARAAATRHLGSDPG